MTFEDAEERYGKVDLMTRTWAGEAKWMKFVNVPEELAFPNWINIATGERVKRFYCNRDMAPALIAALYLIHGRGLQDELKTYDGCLNFRVVRGTIGVLSTHAYGLAIDINARENPLGGPNKLSEGLVKCFTDAGFTWGGKFKRIDSQHFSWAWE